MLGSFSVYPATSLPPVKSQLKPVSGIGTVALAEDGGEARSFSER
jgi:hypothetical protein